MIDGFVGETKSEKTITDLEHISEKILHDSLVKTILCDFYAHFFAGKYLSYFSFQRHKSISAVSKEIRMLMFVWKTACSIRPLFMWLRKKYNFVRAFFPRSTKATAFSSHKDASARHSDYASDNEHLKIENTVTHDNLGDGEIANTSDANVLPISEKSSLNVPQVDKTEQNSVPAETSQSSTFNTSSTKTAATESMVNILPSDSIPRLEGFQKSSWPDGTDSGSFKFGFDAFKSTDIATSKTNPLALDSNDEITSTVNPTTSTAPVMFSFINPETKSSTTNTTFSFGKTDPSADGLTSHSLGSSSTLTLSSANSTSNQAKPSFSFTNATNISTSGNLLQIFSQSVRFNKIFHPNNVLQLENSSKIIIQFWCAS